MIQSILVDTKASKINLDVYAVEQIDGDGKTFLIQFFETEKQRDRWFKVMGSRFINNYPEMGIKKSTFKMEPK